MITGEKETEIGNIGNRDLESVNIQIRLRKKRKLTSGILELELEKCFYSNVITGEKEIDIQTSEIEISKEILQFKYNYRRKRN